MKNQVKTHSCAERERIRFDFNGLEHVTKVPVIGAWPGLPTMTNERSMLQTSKIVVYST